MDHRQNRRPVPSKQSDRDLAAQWRAWMDAACAHYERQGGYQRIIVQKIVVRKAPPPGEHPDLADDLALHTEGAHDLRARIAE